MSFMSILLSSFSKKRILFVIVFKLANLLEWFAKK
jgi:hypothetical protein